MGQKTVLDGVDTCGQTLDIVVVSNLDGLLQDDRSGIDPLVDEVDGYTCPADSIGERLVDGVSAREGWKKRRVQIDYAPWEAAQESR